MYRQCRTCRVGGQNSVEISGIATCSVSTSPIIIYIHEMYSPRSLFQKRMEEDAGMCLQRIRGCRDIGHIAALVHLWNRATREKKDYHIPFINQPRRILCLPIGKAVNSV